MRCLLSILLVLLLCIVLPQDLISAGIYDRGVADPAVSDTHVVNDNHAVSNTFAVGDTPVVSDTSAARDTPVVSDTSAARDTPLVSDTSAANDIPAVSDTLAVSDTPAVSDTSAASDTPAVSDTLAAGDTPAYSDTLAGSDTLSASDTLATSNTFAVGDTLYDTSVAEERIDEIQRRIQQIRSRELGRSQHIPRLGFTESEMDQLRRQYEEDLYIQKLAGMIRLLEMMDDPAAAASAHQTIILPGTPGVSELPALPRDPVTPPERVQLPADTTTQIRVDTLRVTHTDTVFVDRVQTEIIELQRMLETGVFRAFSIVFEFDRAEIMPPSHRILNEVGQLLIDNPEIRIEVQGHTDSVGPRDYNMNLSQRRAESVRSYLLETFPVIEQNRIRAAGFGPDIPITDNETPTQRALNRRVEFVIVE